MQTPGSRHVPELDGLRGIAILSVIVHHQLTPFSLVGGFLGVDLFFVLSGFLITGLLSAEFQKTGTISLRNFYVRRILRLGPALLLYLAACLLVTYHTQLMSVVRELKLISLALAYSTNWRMAFDWDSSLDPTAIVWSLSIEEQFYLVWPLLFFACLALKVRRRVIAFGLAVVIVGIMVHRYSLLVAGASLTRLYYGTDTRADALLLGCLVALLPVASMRAMPRRLLSIASFISAAFLIYLLRTVTFRDQFLYVWGFSFIALLAGIVIFVVANSPPLLLSLLLRWRPLRWFGKISYGLYLWHWLVVRNTSFYYLSYSEPWAKLGLAVVISSASFYLVERKFNKLKTRFSIQRNGSRPYVSVERKITSSPVPVPLAS
jgi:peptidoglycan/LPS O-acetylase OafA/YrhL